MIGFPKKVVIIGAGGHGKEVAETCYERYLHSRDIELLGFLDDKKDLHGTKIYKTKVLGDLDWIGTQKNKNIYFVCSIGNPLIRQRVTHRALKKKYKLITLIHPHANLHNPQKIGKGCIIQPGSHIAPNVVLEDFCHINYNCSVGHDSHLGKFTTLTPLCAISGSVKTEECVYFGTGAIAFPGIKIGKYSIIGAGSVAMNDIKPYTVNVGSPTRIIRHLKKRDFFIQ